MDFGLNDDQQDIQRTARDLIAERASAEKVREAAEAKTTDAALWKELGDIGWPGIAIAEEHGGQGLGLVELAILCEELGRAIAPVPFLPTVAAAAIIEQGGSDEQRARWLPELAAGRAVGAVASVGSADLVIGGADADVIVFVEASGDAASVLAATDATIEPVDAIDPTRPAAKVSGTGEPLPGDVTAGVDRALVAISAELVGVCSGATEMTVAYVKERKQFGTPVGAFQAVAHRCAQMLLDTERARTLTSQAAWSADAAPERLHEAAAMAKATASDAGREVTASAIQAHGGIGFTWEADVHWRYKRAQLDAVLLGGAGEHRARAAKMAAANARAAITA
ncbi:MAG: acyl-CoA/acyl-ACP dehydrogenase [Solirubrobacteraceae bacterium]|nr:acyl-CoA/acyl-ACP dehydrogenase [Solirubrobacteraceae bacterium]